MRERVLVTGATGFIGRHLVPHLVGVGHAVDVVRRDASHGTPAELAGGQVFADLAVDARSLVGRKTVFHLAGIAHDGAAQASEAAFQSVNVDAPVALYRAAAEAGVACFVFLSSIKVLGDTSSSPFTPSDAPYPQDAYARSKARAEEALLAEAVPETRLAIVRPPLVYGAGVVANFLVLLRYGLSGWPLPLGAAVAPRAWLSANNLVALLVRVSEVEATDTIWHVRDGEERSVAEMLRTIAKLGGAPSRLLPVPPGLLLGLGSTLGRRAVAERLVLPLQVDDSATRAALGWSPPHSQDDELDRVIEWYRQR